MIRFRLIALTATLWSMLLGTARAHHGEPRPPIPNFPNNTGYSITSISAEHSVICCSGSRHLVLGWSFDGGDPNHPWSAGSPTVELTSPVIDAAQTFDLYNGSTLKLDRANQDIDPTQTIGPDIVSNDTSTVDIIDSVIDGVQAEDMSNVSVTLTSFTGGFGMNSSGTMTLDSITPRQVPGFPSFGFVGAGKGTTTIVNSTIEELKAEGTASVSISGSTVNGVVEITGEEGSPRITVDGGRVGGLTAPFGSIAITNGTVMGGVKASGTGTIGVTGGTVKGTGTASGSATLNFEGTNIVGNINAGDSSDSISTINVIGGRVGGVVQTVDYGRIHLNGATEIGDGVGNVLLSFGNSVLMVSGTGFINGGVFAGDDSIMSLTSVTDILGSVAAAGRVTLDLTGANVLDGIQALENGTIYMRSGTAPFVFASGEGNIKLEQVSVFGGITATSRSHVTFDVGSQAGQDVIATGEAFMTVRDGEIGGNLEGFDNSITAMSGGHVTGFPVFQGQATFLYSGGTFDFFGIPQAAASSPSSGAGGEKRDPVAGFTISEDAEIQFIGFGLQSALVDPNYSDGSFSYSVYQLTGRLADGSPIDGGLVYVQNFVTARFQLIEAPVPEPSTIALVSMASCFWLRRVRATPPVPKRSRSVCQVSPGE